MDMDAIRAYFDNLKDIIDKVIDTQAEALHKGAQILSQAALKGHNLFAFGCSHAGLWPWNSITGPGVWPSSTL